MSSAIGGMLGINGGASGTGFAAPSNAALTPGTNADQLQTSYGGAQNSLASQQALLTALQAQNGIGNQSQVYNQLQGVANGTGPNPAQTMLNQSTGQNVANQAALMAGQRGAGANVGLMARQAAMQGANTQQQAIGQGATMQANQSLNALGAMGNMANTQAANQIGATTANTQAQQSEQGILQGANQAYNSAQVGMQQNVNSTNAGLAQTDMGEQQGLFNGGLKAIGIGSTMGGGSTPGGARGGMVKKMAGGGQAQPMQQQSPQMTQNMGVMPSQNGPQSMMGQFLAGWSQLQPSQTNYGQWGAGVGSYKAPQQGKGSTPSSLPVGGNSALGSDMGGTGGIGIGDTTMAGGAMDTGGASALAADAPLIAASRGGNVGSKLKSGGHVPGKPKVRGNSYENDTVKALLSPGEVVIPNSVMQSKNPAEGAARFVQAVLAKKGKK